MGKKDKGKKGEDELDDDEWKAANSSKKEEAKELFKSRAKVVKRQWSKKYQKLWRKQEWPRKIQEKRKTNKTLD